MTKCFCSLFFTSSLKKGRNKCAASRFYHMVALFLQELSWSGINFSINISEYLLHIVCGRLLRAFSLKQLLVAAENITLSCGSEAKQLSCATDSSDCFSVAANSWSQIFFIHSWQLSKFPCTWNIINPPGTLCGTLNKCLMWSEKSHDPKYKQMFSNKH